MLKRSLSEKNIHNLFIFNEAGLCLYNRSFTDVYDIGDKQLMTGFFTALRAFTMEFIKTPFKTLEMGNVKLAVIKKNAMYYGLLCDSIEHPVLLEDIISKIDKQFFEYVEKNNVNIASQFVNDKNFNKTVDEIIEEPFSSEFDPSKEERIIDELSDLIIYNDILGIALLTDKGKILYSSLSQKDLKNFLKEIGFRVKVCNNNILKMFYTSKNNDLIFSEYVEDLYFVILIFSATTKMTVSNFYLQKAVKIIKKHLKSESKISDILLENELQS